MKLSDGSERSQRTEGGEMRASDVVGGRTWEEAKKDEVKLEQGG